MLRLVITKRTEPKLLELMKRHYSQPKGFVGRNICYAIYYNDIYYGHIIAGSATLHLPGRKEFFGEVNLNQIINNIFYHIEKVNNKYPVRNFAEKVLDKFVEVSTTDWEKKYGDKVIGFESLVELPRTGEIYKRTKWFLAGTTKGFTCKRVGGLPSTDSWSGTRVWNYNELKPKLVFYKKVINV